MMSERDSNNGLIERRTIPNNSLARKYDNLHATPTKASERAKTFPPLGGANAIIADYLKDLKGKLIELGCGRGELILQSPEHFDLKVGVDFSEYFLKDAIMFTEKYSRQKNRIRWLLHDLNEPLPFESSYFDVAVSMACIEHTFDVYNIFRETNRCLKDEGYFFFSVPNIAYIKHRIRLLLGLQPVTGSSMDLWWRDYWDGTHIHYFTIGSLKMLLKQTGFKFVDVTGSGRLRDLRSWWPTLLCGDLIVTAKKYSNVEIVNQGTCK